MAASWNQMPDLESNLQFFQRYFRFIDDMILYIKEYKNCPIPIEAPFPYSAFTSNIGRMVLRTMRSISNSNFETKLREVFNTCSTTLDERTHISKIGEFLFDYAYELKSNNLDDYFQFFAVLGRLCLKFYANGMEKCASMTKKYAEHFLFFYLNDFRKLDALNDYAVGMLHGVN